MKTLAAVRYALGAAALVALLTACSGSNSASPVPIQRLSQLQNHVQPTGNHYKVLHSFGGGADGVDPSGGLTPMDGLLYGVTSYGGAYGKGTVFSITPSGTENVLYSFEGAPDGNGPTGALIDVGGTLYGTTEFGGTYDNGGTVFSVTPGGSEKVLYSFAGGNDGYDPSGGLTLLSGVLFGTTVNGGDGYGTVFSVTTSGQETVLYVFSGGGDGAAPNGQLIAVKGVLYGTTFYGGRCVIQEGCGTVFKVTTSGHETALYRFKGSSYDDPSKDGGNPAAGLLALKGKLYGTTAFGGNSNGQSCGTVFEVSMSGRERIIYRFDCTNGDGRIPYSNLIPAGGLLYGTTSGGGVPYSEYCERDGCGTIFSVSTAGEEQVLHRFGGYYSDGDGAYPFAGLTALKNRLYGATYAGGLSHCDSAGCGTVFKIAK